MERLFLDIMEKTATTVGYIAVIVISAWSATCLYFAVKHALKVFILPCIKNGLIY